MPSTRNIADALKISRNTAKLAVQGLVEQGVLSTRDRSGAYVATESSLIPSGPAEDESGIDWNERFAVKIEPQVQISSRSVRSTSFLYGQFDPSVFPISRWRECERAASSLIEIQNWGRDVVDEDDPRLIDQLREQVLPRHGIFARADNILITLGGQQGRYLVSQLFGGMGTITGMEHPGMPDMAKILSLSRTQLRPLEVDEDGLVLGKQLTGCNTVIVTCGHQCPTTAVMPIARRQALIAQAHHDDFIIVEDTFETELFAEPEHLPALKSMPGGERIIHVASLSKLIAPGLRIGYVVAPAPVIAQMRAMRRLIHRHPPGNNQRALAIFIERGYYRAFLRRAQSVMYERESIMAQALDVHFKGFEWLHCPGASTFWVRLPRFANSGSLVATAAAHGILVEPGDKYFYDKLPAGLFFRLSVSSIPASRIPGSIERLAKAFADAERQR